jgi:Fe-S oxidoreductase
MQVALMVPCYIDMFYPHDGIATLELLERLGVDVVYPNEQTCCGQSTANSGCYEEARATEDHCARVFGSFDCVVTPSGSCTHHIRNKFTAGADSSEKQNLVRNTYDLVEFLHLMTGPSGSGDISGIAVRPVQGVKTLTFCFVPLRMQVSALDECKIMDMQAICSSFRQPER